MPERLQALLVPDATRATPTAAWWTVVALGGAALLLALHGLADIDTRQFWLLTAGVAVTVAAGCLAVRVPHSAQTVAVDDVFIILLLLQLGPGAATVAAGIAAAARTWRSPRPWTSRIAYPALTALAMAAAGHALQALLDALQRRLLGQPGLLLLAAVGFAVLHVAIHAGLLATLARPWRAARARLADQVGPLGWTATAHAASAALATLLVLAWRQSGMGVLAAAVPLMATMLLALHFFFRQQETAKAAHRSAAEAADHAAALAVSHRQAQRQLAFHDNLTGLPNRQGFLARLAETVQRGEAAPDPHGFAVISLDIDRFRLVNDSLGHAAGDAVLRQAAQRLRDTIAPQHLLARVGGDAFAVLVVDPAGQPAAGALAEQLLAAMGAPFCVAGTVVHSSASIGITFSALPRPRPEDMLRDADLAMHQAKARGKARAALFDTQLQAQAQLRVRLETDLRSALQADQISLAYQPIFDLASGRVTAVEALARWSHPQLGPVSPSTFVAIAADAGLTNALTGHLVQRACRQLQQWRRSVPGTDGLAVHVNITGHDLVHAGLAGRLLQALQAHGLQPRHLRLELGENTLMQHLTAALPVLATLRAAGIGLSLDDFGSGFSSLGHLHRLPIDSLKIDPSFVQALQAGQGTGADAAVVRAVVELGRSLGKSVVAEGIESASQLALLRAMGCLQGQGYHLAPPLAADAVPALLAQTGLMQPLAPVALPASLPVASALRH